MLKWLNMRKLPNFSYQLATIKTDVALDKTFDDLVVNEPNLDKLLEMFTRYEFKRWISDLQNGGWLAQRSSRKAPVPYSAEVATPKSSHPQTISRYLKRTMSLY